MPGSNVACSVAASDMQWKPQFCTCRATQVGATVVDCCNRFALILDDTLMENKQGHTAQQFEAQLLSKRLLAGEKIAVTCPDRRPSEILTFLFLHPV